MKLLEAQPEIAPTPPPEPPGESAPERAPVEPGARTCKSCGATMAPDQDWCLACGTAARRLDQRPGARSAVTMLGLMLVLVAGAVAASYAALTDDHSVPTRTAAAPSQVAQTPPAATTPPPATSTNPPPAATSSTPTTTKPKKLPKVHVPANTSHVPAPKATPATPPKTPKASTPAPTPPPATPPATGGGSQTAPTPAAPKPATPKPAAPVAIDLAANAASVYDPYRRAQATGDPGKALDGDGGTSWYVDTAPGAPTVGVGYALNLGQERGIKSLDITSPTPGFKLEVYASDETTPPPTILDTRWAHITDKSDVGEDGKTHIVLGAGTSKYQTLLLWITQPPPDGARVRIAELKVFG